MVVFPIPGSPVTKIVWRSPASARSSQPRILPNSVSRPNSTLAVAEEFKEAIFDANCGTGASSRILSFLLAERSEIFPMKR